MDQAAPPGDTMSVDHTNDVVDRLPVNQTFFRALVTAEVFRLTGRNLDDLERDTLGDYLGPNETLDPVRGRQLVHDVALEILSDNGLEIEF
jgi:hypothetical protein